MKRAILSVLATLVLLSALVPLTAWQNTPTIGVLPDSGPNLPATCVVGQIYFKTTATIGLYQCATVNTWTTAGGGVPASVSVRSCDISLGDGENAITAGTYDALVGCKNDNGATITITGVQCFTDSGTSTCDAKTSHAGTPDILTGAITGTTAFAAGTQSATTTVLTGEWLTGTLVTDGTTKRIVLHVIGTL